MCRVAEEEEAAKDGTSTTTSDARAPEDAATAAVGSHVSPTDAEKPEPPPVVEEQLLEPPTSSQPTDMDAVGHNRNDVVMDAHQEADEVAASSVADDNLKSPKQPEIIAAESGKSVEQPPAEPSLAASFAVDGFDPVNNDADWSDLQSMLKGDGNIFHSPFAKAHRT